MEGDGTNLRFAGAVGGEINTVATPNTKDDKKREPPSPLYQDMTQKKTRHIPGEENSDGDFLGESHDTHVGSDVHVLSQPVNPLDIVQIATELRLMMLPELKPLCSEQLPMMQKW